MQAGCFLPFLGNSNCLLFVLFKNVIAFLFAKYAEQALSESQAQQKVDRTLNSGPRKKVDKLTKEFYFFSGGKKNPWGWQKYNDLGIC